MGSGMSGLYSGTYGHLQSIAAKMLDYLFDEPTATVWAHITPTQPNYSGTEIPRSFKLQTDSNEVWIHGNATEHMQEFVSSLNTEYKLRQSNPKLLSQFILYDFRKSLNKVLNQGMPKHKPVTSGKWTFVISQRKGDELPVVHHAVFKGLK